MNEKICIDKRIILLILFSLPVAAILYLSLYTNNTKVLLNSKASEAGNAPMVMKQNPLLEEVRAFCMNVRKNTLKKEIDLYLEPRADIIAASLKIYYIQGDEPVYLGVVSWPFPSDMSKPLYTVKMSVFTGLDRLKFIGVQNGEEKDIKLFADTCLVPVSVTQ